MIINNKDTKEFGAALLDYSIENSEVVNYDDWMDGSFSPMTHKQVFKFSYLECNFLFEQNNDDIAEMMISNFRKYTSKAEIKIEDLMRTYKGVLDEINKEKIVRGKFELTLKWKCEYSFKEEPEITLDGREGSLFVPGNTETPAGVEITPAINLIDLNIFGLGEDILIENLTANKKIIIDGEEGKVTEEGQIKFKDKENWEKDIKELLDIENEINIYKFKIDELEGYSMTPAELITIKYMIEE